MKKIILSVLSACAAVILSAQDKPFSITPDVQTKVIQAGSPLKVKIAWKCPEGYAPKAWRLIAYVPNIPADFAKVTGSKINQHKMKEWSDVVIMNWLWKIPADAVLEKDTAKWPAGDYRMVLYITFQGKDKDGRLQTKMASENIFFTIVKNAASK